MPTTTRLIYETRLQQARDIHADVERRVKTGDLTPERGEWVIKEAIRQLLNS